MSLLSFKNRSLKFRLNSNLAVILVLFIAVGGFGLYAFNQVLQSVISSYGASKVVGYVDNLAEGRSNFLYSGQEVLTQIAQGQKTPNMDDVEIEIETIDGAVLGLAGELLAEPLWAGRAAVIEADWKEVKGHINQWAKEAASGELDAAVVSSNFKKLASELSTYLKSVKLLGEESGTVFQNSYGTAYFYANTGKWLGLGAIGILIATLTLSALMYSRLSRMLADTVKDIGKNSSLVGLSSTNVKEASQNVSSSTTEQASAIQETVATLNEITAMVNKSVENAKNSTEKAQNSHRVASEGKQAVEEMLRAMSEIDDSNNVIMSQIDDSNKQISEIVKVITEISNKTNVINDIVFQTKLLSFNASVEAARAGEHGKGFAVVAEEVGNLAKMSGKAADEIASMLSDSIEKVNGIVNDTKSKVERLVDEGKSKVESGVVIAKRCDEILDEVVENVGQVRSMMSEVALASEEQAEGVRNITTAMSELDDTTHANSDTAHRTSTYASELSEQSLSLGKAVKRIEGVIYGESLSRHLSEDADDSDEGEIHAERSANVVSLSKSKVGRTKDKHSSASLGSNKSLQAQGKQSQKAEFKKASGLEGIPAENDPRFEEV